MNFRPSGQRHSMSFVSGGTLEVDGLSNHTSLAAPKTAQDPPEPIPAQLGGVACTSYRNTIELKSPPLRSLRPGVSSAPVEVRSRPKTLQDSPAPATAQMAARNPANAQVISLCDSDASDSSDSDVEIVDLHESYNDKSCHDSGDYHDDDGDDDDDDVTVVFPHAVNDEVQFIRKVHVVVDASVANKYGTTPNAQKPKAANLSTDPEIEVLPNGPGPQFELCDICDSHFPASELLEHLKSIAHQIRITDTPKEPLKQSTSIDRTSIGYKIMKAMNWKGEGLGLNEQGPLDPISVIFKSDRKGLGSKGSKKTVDQVVMKGNIKRKKMFTRVNSASDIL